MHPLTKIASSLICLTASFAFAGCGESQAEKARQANERQRIELEKQATREHQAANQAVTEIEKKLGRKSKPLDLNLPEEKNAEPASPTPK